MSPQAKHRLRSLRDVTILRAAMGDFGLVELCRAGLAQRRYIAGRPVHAPSEPALEQCDYELTEQGRRSAERLFG